MTERIIITCGRCGVYNVFEKTDQALYCIAPDCRILLRKAKSSKGGK
jgi:hypothetical protein